MIPVELIFSLSMAALIIVVITAMQVCCTRPTEEEKHMHQRYQQQRGANSAKQNAHFTPGIALACAVGKSD